MAGQGMKSRCISKSERSSASTGKNYHKLMGLQFELHSGSLIRQFGQIRGLAAMYKSSIIQM
jgi:hypothetical protein